MNIKKCFVLLLIAAATIFAVKLGRPGENVYMNGSRTGVGVDTTDTPDAFLEIKSTTDGLLIPRLSIAQRDAIPSPATGVMIFNTDCGLFNYFDGSSWIPFPNLTELVVGPITGYLLVCEGASSVGYSIPEITDAIDYDWSLPAGATIASGAGTRSITVDFGTEGGRICVTANTPCGSLFDCLTMAVSDAPVGGTVTGGGTISYGESTGILTLSGHSGTIDRWQKRLDSGAWTDVFHTGTTYFETPTSTGVWDYRAVTTSPGCTEVYSDFASVTVEGVAGGDTVNFAYTGTIVTWTVPTGVTEITIEAWGAQGGGSYSGLGARIKGTFAVSPGDVLKVLVGQQGSSSGLMTSGGGGSFVATSTDTPLLIAGGGGGADRTDTNRHGSTGTAGQSGIATYASAAGGTGGNGGTSTGGYGHGGGGGGFFTGGVGNSAGTAFVDGGAGGVGYGADARINGGFGGGGGAAHNYTGDQYWGGGAGGGYSGGGGACASGSGNTHSAGGGGSYNSGTDQSNASGVNTGVGKVSIYY